MPVIEVTKSLHTELQSARAESDGLFSILKPQALYERPIAERHRVIFYIGHLDGFDSIQICREGLGLPSFDPQLDALFQAGIDPDAAHLPSDTPADWPSLEEIRKYVIRCREQVDKHLEDAPEDTVAMAVEHRLMHLETLAYMFHNFDHALKHDTGNQPFNRTATPSPENCFIEIPGGESVLGKPRDGTFGWDNEYVETRVKVPAFRVQKYSVSNGEYLRFVQDGAKRPHFWTDDFRYRGMLEEIPLPLNWPVYVTQSEAAAYARWAGKSLLTEEQFHRAAYADDDLYPWGNAAPTAQHGNFDFRRWDPEPVDTSPAGASRAGVHQLVGNGWQWTSTVFGPLPGFEPRPTYPGYSANFFDGQHFVMKGGSPRTAARLLRRSFRNWFRADYPYMYATFRLVEN